MKVNWVPKKEINDTMVNELLIDSKLTNHFTNYGPNVQRLEKIVKEKLQVDDKIVVCVDNGTSALHALCACYELYFNKKLKWATQSFTFPASAQGYLSGAKIFDIDDEGGLDLKLVGEDIDGIIVTNIFGNVVDIDKYVQWGKKNNKLLVFDNAATAFTKYKGKNSLNYGDASTISFHHTKPIGFGEGGAIILDKKYEQCLRRIINFGLTEGESWLRIGSNYKMSDIAAIYIIQYIDNLQKIMDIHGDLYKYFEAKITKLNGVKMFPNFSSNTPFVSCFCLLFDNYDDQTRLNLLNNGIFCRKYYKPLDGSKVSNDIYSKILCIPCTKDMNYKQLDFIIPIILNKD